CNCRREYLADFFSAGPKTGESLAAMHMLRSRKSTRLDCSRRKLLGCAQRFRLERQTQTVADQFCAGEGQFFGADFNACQLGNSRQFQGKQGAPEQHTAMLEHSAFAAPLSAAN